MKFRTSLVYAGLFFATFVTACGDASHISASGNGSTTLAGDDQPDLIDDSFFTFRACKKANSSQIKKVDQGNAKKQNFLDACAKATASSAWCNQLVRPNPDSVSVFRCTYGETQVHQLINPDEGTWKHAFNAVKMIQELEQRGFRIKIIYNWWRPEPYNENVGGAPGRHPFGTSVDVRFNTNDEANRAFDILCDYRKKGKIRAIGHYGTNALHFGMGDSSGNTWGRDCP